MTASHSKNQSYFYLSKRALERTASGGDDNNGLEYDGSNKTSDGRQANRLRISLNRQVYSSIVSSNDLAIILTGSVWGLRDNFMISGTRRFVLYLSFLWLLCHHFTEINIVAAYCVRTFAESILRSHGSIQKLFRYNTLSLVFNCYRFYTHIRNQCNALVKGSPTFSVDPV